MLFQNTTLEGFKVDVRIDQGLIHTVAESGSLPVEPGETVRRGGMLTPHLAEPHVHLDAALLGARKPNRSGTLVEGIENWAELRAELTAEDVIHRAMQTVEMYAKYGTTTLRTHVDTGSLLAVEAMIEVRTQLAHTGITLEIVAFPQEGILRTQKCQQNWEDALQMGVDAVGGIPHYERTTEEGWASVRLAFDMAEKHSLKLDFHCDETDDPNSRNLEVVCAETLKRGLQGQVVAGHCTAMHSYPNPYAAKIIDLVAESQVQIVTNPLDNIVLQGRYDTYPRRRGHTRVDELWAANAIVGIGHDSVMDPWYRLGTANLVDAAYMLVHYAHLTSEADMNRTFATLYSENHLPFGQCPVIKKGQSANVLWWPQDNAIDVLRLRPTPKVFTA